MKKIYMTPATEQHYIELTLLTQVSSLRQVVDKEASVEGTGDDASYSNSLGRFGDFFDDED